MYIVMEKKVYKIRRWFSNSKFPEEPMRILPRCDYDDEYDAKEEFRSLANCYLRDGCKIVYITHLWNYTFQTPRGARFDFYMYED